MLKNDNNNLCLVTNYKYFFSIFFPEAFVDPAGESDENGMHGINIVNLEDSSLQQAEPEQERESVSSIPGNLSSRNNYHWRQSVYLSSNENVTGLYIFYCNLSCTLMLILLIVDVTVKFLNVSWTSEVDKPFCKDRNVYPVDVAGLRR